MRHAPPHARSAPARRRTLVGFLLAVLPALTGCATAQQFMALEDVDFAFDQLSEIRLAGVDVTDVRSFSDLSFSEGATIAAAVSDRRLPLDVVVQVGATNPPDNVDARMVRLDWTLFLDGTETVSGFLDEEILIPAGESRIFPVDASLDLLQFFGGSARDLVDLAASLAGVGGEPKEVALEILPTIQTMLGPIRYDRPLRIGRTVGQE